MAYVMATATKTATAMVTGTATAIAMAMAAARAIMAKRGLPVYVPAMCSTVAGATPCHYPHGHKGVYIHQRWVMRVMLQRGFAPFEGGGFLTAHRELFVFSF